jgi:hypothetical protein
MGVRDGRLWWEVRIHWRRVRTIVEFRWFSRSRWVGIWFSTLWLRMIVSHAIAHQRASVKSFIALLTCGVCARGSCQEVSGALLSPESEVGS